MTAGFTPTYIRWYNSESNGKIACHSGPYEALAYGSVSRNEFHAQDRPPHPEHGQYQWGLACSKTSRTIIIDIDKPAEWEHTNTWVELGDIGDCATSYREDGERFHIAVMVPENLLHLWPRQGPTMFGDVKSSGFSYHEGVHYTGLRYVASSNPWITADADLMNALTADRIFPMGKGGGSGGMAGDWENDEYRVTGHDECVATVYDMVYAGLDADAVHARLEVIMPNREGDWPERHAYIDEKIRSAARKIDERERKEQEFWGAFHPEGYDALVREVQNRVIQQAADATPKNITQDGTQFNEHHLARGTDLRHIPLCERLNPQHRPIEPRATSDRVISADILETGLHAFRLADDEGCWLVNTGDHWETWGTKSEKTEIGRTIVSSYGEYLKTDKALKEELAAQGSANSEEQIAEDDSRRERLVKARQKFGNTPGQSSIASALITEARASGRYSVNVASLDSEPDVLWAGGYPWSLRHTDLTLATDVRIVNPVHMKTCPVGPAPGPHPAFDQVLEAVWPDPAVRAWALREVAGLMLWGATSKMHPVLDGPPQGGKSTFSLILKRILGTYAVQVSPDKILGSDTSAAAEEEVAAMIGARMVWMDEPPPGGKQSVSRFNDLASGTGDLAAARKYQNRITAPKLFNFLICQNPRNGLRMDAQGVGERMIYIPCSGTPEATRAAWARWSAEGEAEYPAVLAMLIRECALFRTGERLEVPLAAQVGRVAAQERSDEFGTWVLENYDILDAAIVTTDKRLMEAPTAGAMRTLYNDTFARPNRLPVIDATGTRDQLARLGIRVSTAGDSANRRRKDVAWLSPKPHIMTRAF